MGDLLEAVRATGLLRPGHPVVVLLSGGRDSVCLLDVAVRLAGPVTALHVDYGLRDASAADAALCARLCERLGVPLEVRSPARPARGNLQAWARGIRYAEAHRLAEEAGADVAAGHTATDQVETVLYRLAASPGRRALLGMAARDGRLVRPLLGVDRAATAAHCAARGLPYADDATNAGTAFARGRVRHGLVPALRAIHPAAEANLLRTLSVLRDEAAVLDAAVDAVLDGDAVPTARLAAAPAALARLALQRLADAAAGGTGPPVGARLDAVLAAAAAGGTRSVDLGAGLRAEAVYGVVRVVGGQDAPGPAPAPVALAVPGRVAFGHGEVRAEAAGNGPAREGTLDADAAGTALTVRARRPGDRMRPLGCGGSRSLQDLLVDRRVPRAARAALPVVEARGRIAWIPGVATGEDFAVTSATTRRVQLAWDPPGRTYP